MNIRLLTIIFLLNSTVIFSQNDVIAIVEEGITYHDMGEFDKAIEIYKTALDIDPQSTMVFYEIGLSYYHKGDYRTAIKYYDKVLKKNKKYLLPATINKGLSLDKIGKSKAALKLFKQAVKDFENEPRLHYNLGYQYYQKNDTENAIREVARAIELDPGYSTSHLLMGFLQFNKNNRVQALLSYHYFLLLEPESDRAEGVFYDINNIMGGNVSVGKDDPKSINISLSANLNSEFSASELLLALLVAQNNEEKNKDKAPEELFIHNTTRFFQHLGEMRANKINPEGIYWNLYIPFFERLAASDHMPAYFHHITEHLIEDSATWIETHTLEMFAFEKWLDR